MKLLLLSTNKIDPIEQTPYAARIKEREIATWDSQECALCISSFVQGRQG